MSVRNVSLAEYALSMRVFASSLPRRERIWISDEIGLQDRAYTIDGGFGGDFGIRVGPTAYLDCTSKAPYQPGAQPTDAMFIHEMTHVWQYDIGYYVRLSSGSAQVLQWIKIARAYDIPDESSWDNSKSWDDFNVEQQASIVEAWYTGGLRPDSVLFPYIDKVVRRRGADKLRTLGQLKTP